SLLALWLTGTRAWFADPEIALAAAIAAWTGTLALIGIASRAWLRAAWHAGDARRWAFAAAYLWVLLAPRPMAYGFVALAPAPLFFSPHPFAGARGRLALALALSAQGLLKAVNLETRTLLVFYAPALLALAVWLLIVQEKAAPLTASPRRPS